MMQNDIIPQLPKVAGVYQPRFSLAGATTLKLGGPAQVLYTPQSFADMGVFLQHKPQDIALTLLGEGSNILVRDGGIPGVVTRFGAGCDNVTIDGTTMRAEAGASTGKVARMARTAELSGVEFICGIPGSMGGALVMNAGCYGGELVDVLTAVEVLTDKGELLTLKPEELGFSYRHSRLPEGWIFVAAQMQLAQGNRDSIREAMREVNHKRSASQPLEWPNAGSFFKNPAGHKAWQLIEEAGCRGLRKGDAQVSEKHCNFFINLGSATASDMEDLAEEVRVAVKHHSGIELEWEVRRLGLRACTF